MTNTSSHGQISINSCMKSAVAPLPIVLIGAVQVSTFDIVVRPPDKTARRTHIQPARNLWPAGSSFFICHLTTPAMFPAFVAGKSVCYRSHANGTRCFRNCRLARYIAIVPGSTGMARRTRNGYDSPACGTKPKPHKIARCTNPRPHNTRDRSCLPYFGD